MQRLVWLGLEFTGTTEKSWCTWAEEAIHSSALMPRSWVDLLAAGQDHLSYLTFTDYISFSCSLTGARLKVFMPKRNAFSKQLEYNYIKHTKLSIIKPLKTWVNNPTTIIISWVRCCLKQRIVCSCRTTSLIVRCCISFSGPLLDSGNTSHGDHWRHS